MKQKEIVVQTAKCKCQFSNSTDVLKVKTHQRHYANDAGATTKLIATDKEIGMTFEKNTFGKCKLQPTSSGHLPCVPALTQWTGQYQKVTLTNQGKVLLEDSKGICNIAGAPCIAFIHSGQQAEVSSQNIKNADENLLSEANPMASLKEDTKTAIDNRKITTDASAQYNA